MSWKGRQDEYGKRILFCLYAYWLLVGLQGQSTGFLMLGLPSRPYSSTSSVWVIFNLLRAAYCLSRAWTGCSGRDWAVWGQYLSVINFSVGHGWHNCKQYDEFGPCGLSKERQSFLEKIRMIQPKYLASFMLASSACVWYSFPFESRTLSPPSTCNFIERIQGARMGSLPWLVHYPISNRRFAM